MTDIAIIGGTGALGGALARRLALTGRRVIIGSRDADKARAFAADLMALTPGSAIEGATLEEAANGAELIFLTVPFSAHEDTLRVIRPFAQGRIVVDATVPLRPPKVGTVQLPASGSVVVDGAHLLGPDVRVVSALQNIGAEKLASSDAIEADVLVAGDDADAVREVRGLLEEIGLRSWHVGPLTNSAAAEALTSVLIQINRRYKMVQAGIRISGSKGDARAAPTALSVTAVPGLPRFSAGDDLAGLVADAIEATGLRLEEDDVLVVAQKVVSKVEGRLRALAEVRPGDEARSIAAETGKDAAVVELVRQEASEVMRRVPGVLITRHRTGHVLANSGIDSSNVAPADEHEVLLWPEDPDASARRLRSALRHRFGLRIAVIVSDSLGRAWRIGTTGSAIGVAGMSPVRDRRGETDLNGRVLEATVIGVADEIAGAASLVIGEAAEGLPVAIVRGVRYTIDDDGSIGALLRPLEEDLFR